MHFGTFASHVRILARVNPPLPLQARRQLPQVASTSEQRHSAFGSVSKWPVTGEISAGCCFRGRCLCELVSRRRVLLQCCSACGHVGLHEAQIYMMTASVLSGTSAWKATNNSCGA